MRVALCTGVRMYSQSDAATRPKANPERPATNAPAKVAKRNNGISKGIPSMARSIEKASSACMGSPLNGEAATPPTHHHSRKDTTSLEIASRHNQGSTLGDETKICSLAYRDGR